jgi:uncharacterized repeat protein (TIGR01451 family)
LSQPPPSADLSVIKSAKSTTIASGGDISYRLTVHNAGPSVAQNVMVQDVIPTNTSFLAASMGSSVGWSMNAPAVGSTGQVRFTKVSVPIGETADFNIVVRTNPTFAGGIINRATIESASTPDPNTANNSATADVNVLAVRRALLVFDQPGDNGRAVLQGSRQTPVTFTDNVPDAGELNIALKGFPPGMSLVRFRRVTLAGVLPPFDASMQRRLTAVVNAVKANAGTVNSSNTEQLSNKDRNGLANAGISLTGFDEIIYLDFG